MKHALFLIGLFVATLYTRAASAVPVVEDKEKGIAVNVGALIQPQFQMTTPGTSGGDRDPCPARRCSPGIGNPRGSASYDFFIRRARIMVWGSATKEISYFIDTDEPNLGKGGVYTTSTFVQDAFLTYAFRPELKLDAGLMLIPLTHHTLEGATSLNALDYHTDVIRFPAGRVFRDVGVQLRGLALSDHLHYRLGIFEGVRAGAVGALPAGLPPKPTINPGGVPRFAAQVRGNILGSEPDFFMKGIYFSKTPIITVGVGVDYQPNSVMKFKNDTTLQYGNYLAASGDAFVEYPFSEADELIVKGSFVYWATGTDNIASAGAFRLAEPGATAFYAEAGFRHAWIEPLVFIDDVMGKEIQGVTGPNKTMSITGLHGGVNFWVMKHNLNFKTDFGYKTTKRGPESTLKDIIWTTQAQLFF